MLRRIFAARTVASTRPVVSAIVSGSTKFTSSSASSSSSKWTRFGFRAAAGFATSAVIAGSTTVSVLCASRGSKSSAYNPSQYPKGHVPRPDVPIYTIDEVKKHTDAKSLWVTYNGGVYDVTEFISGHPGGAGRLCMAGGCELSIFFDTYRTHYQSHILGFIERFRIGNVSPSDAAKLKTEFVFNNPYANDPERPNKDFLHTTEYPFCGEALLKRIGETFYTPNDLFYARLHLPVPETDEKDWRLTVKGEGIKGEHSFSLNDLQKKFKHHEIAVTLQCAGNRREDYHDRVGHNDKRNQVFISPQWRVAAISNAKWKGVYVRDVLKSCGLDVNGLYELEGAHPNIKHVHYDAEDMSEDGAFYGISIPIEKAVDPRGDAMLVWEMNGEPLPRDHGAPVRALTPGHVGNKSCKFINSITVSNVESPKPWHQKAYVMFAPNISFEEHLWKWGSQAKEFFAPDKSKISQLMPVQSLITWPPPDATIGVKGTNKDTVSVRGIGWSGNGIGMTRVDVSADAGKNWCASDFDAKPADVQKRETWGRIWSWSVFRKDVPLPDDAKAKLAKGEVACVELVSKGMDTQFNVQPEHWSSFYNPRGIVVNHMYRFPVCLDPKLRGGQVIETKGEDHFNPPTGGHVASRGGRGWQLHGWGAPEAKWHEKFVADAKANKK